MDSINDLSAEAHRLTSEARRSILDNHPDPCVRYLTALRELLNEQPTLEAGGACESSKSSE